MHQHGQRFVEKDILEYRYVYNYLLFVRHVFIFMRETCVYRSSSVSVCKCVLICQANVYMCSRVCVRMCVYVCIYYVSSYALTLIY